MLSYLHQPVIKKVICMKSLLLYCLIVFAIVYGHQGLSAELGFDGGFDGEKLVVVGEGAL